MQPHGRGGEIERKGGGKRKVTICENGKTSSRKEANKNLLLKYFHKYKLDCPCNRLFTL